MSATLRDQTKKQWNCWSTSIWTSTASHHLTNTCIHARISHFFCVDEHNARSLGNNFETLCTWYVSNRKPETRTTIKSCQIWQASMLQRSSSVGCCAVSLYGTQANGHNVFQNIPPRRRIASFSSGPSDLSNLNGLTAFNPACNNLNATCSTCSKIHKTLLQSTSV